jgi:hypothetical protein
MAPKAKGVNQPFMNAWCLYKQKAYYNIYTPPAAGYCHELIHSCTSSFSKIHFNIILPHTPTFRTSSWYLTNIFVMHFSFSPCPLWIMYGSESGYNKDSTNIPQAVGGSKNKM